MKHGHISFLVLLFLIGGLGFIVPQVSALPASGPAGGATSFTTTHFPMQEDLENGDPVIIISPPIDYGPGQGPWKKVFGAQTSPTTFLQGEAPGFIIPISETIDVNSGEWTDWHEEIQNAPSQIATALWGYISTPGPMFPTFSTVPPRPIVNNDSIQLSSDSIWINFDPPLLPGTILFINKYIQCDPTAILPNFCKFDLTVHQFPTSDLDYGDLEDPAFPTKLGSDGARHFPGVVLLGATEDVEPDGQPTAAADGDDMSGDDEDNISFTSSIVPGAIASVTITTVGDGVIDAWMDFNLDGDFDLPSEKITFIEGAAVTAATTGKTFLVPGGASIGTADSRWRVSDAGTPLPTGYSATGEVEDHQFEIIADNGGPGPRTAVGGIFEPIDTTAVLIAGVQSNALSILAGLMVIGAVAFGALYVSVKRKHN